MTARPSTLGALRASGYPDRTVKQEVAANAAARIRAGQPLVEGLVGFDDTVLPALETSLLAGHDFILLGERGQAKSRILRALVELLDDAIPVVAGSEVHDHPYHPFSPFARAARGRRRATPPPSSGSAARTATPRSSRRPTSRWPTWSATSIPIKVAEGRHLGRRAHHPLRPRPAPPPRDRGDQRAPRPGRAHPGRAAQRDGGARRAGARLLAAPAAGPAGGRDRQPRGLHQPRSHHHPAQGPLRRRDPHALPRHVRGGGRDPRAAGRPRADHARRSRPAARGRAALHGRGAGRAHPRPARRSRGQPALRRLRALLARQLRDARGLRGAARGPRRRVDRGRAPHRSPGGAGRLPRQGRVRVLRGGSRARDRHPPRHGAPCSRSSAAACAAPTSSRSCASSTRACVVETGDLLAATDLLRQLGDVPGPRRACCRPSTSTRSPAPPPRRSSSPSRACTSRGGSTAPRPVACIRYEAG